MGQFLGGVLYGDGVFTLQIAHHFPPWHFVSNIPPVQPFESSFRSTITARHSPRWHVDDFITPQSRHAPGRWLSDRATAFAIAAFRIVVTRSLLPACRVALFANNGDTV